MNQKTMLFWAVLMEILLTMNEYMAKCSNKVASRPARLVC